MEDREETIAQVEALRLNRDIQVVLQPTEDHRGNLLWTEGDLA